MAALIDAARAARGEAQRLRGDSHELRLALRANARANQVRLAAAETARALARSRSAIPCASPWSGLMWLRDDEALHTVLLRVD